MRAKQGAWKAIISMFCCLNLGTVLFMNRPFWLMEDTSRFINGHFSPMTAWRSGVASWWVQKYAYLAGLDNRWRMFSYAYRSNWWYVFVGRYSDSSSVTLPPSPSGLLERDFFNFREAKFHLNIYANPSAQAAYADYLCRTYGRIDGHAASATLQSITLELHYQGYLDREEALRVGTHLEPNSHSMVKDFFRCSGA